MPRTDGVERGGRRPPLSLELFRLLQDHKESGELHCRNNPFNYNLIGDFFHLFTVTLSRLRSGLKEGEDSAQY